jgi:hypothetical protein
MPNPNPNPRPRSAGRQAAEWVLLGAFAGAALLWFAAEAGVPVLSPALEWLAGLAYAHFVPLREFDADGEFATFVAAGLGFILLYGAGLPLTPTFAKWIREGNRKRLTRELEQERAKQDRRPGADDDGFIAEGLWPGKEDQP